MLSETTAKVAERLKEPLGPVPRLLVLDDDAATGRLVARIAAGAGYHPYVAITAEQFRATCQDTPPDVIVLDLQLGSTDGVEQVRQLAERKSDQALILISGFNSRILATVQQLAANLGLTVAGSFSKPLDVEQMRETLERLRVRVDEFAPERMLQGIRNREFVLEYQPIVARPTRSVSRLEALMRWRHPQLGLIEPHRFLHVADDHPDLAAALTDWSFDQVIHDFRLLADQDITLPIAVNLPPNCVLDLTFPDALERRLTLGDMPPDRLCLEITESRAFQDPVRSMDILSRLRLKGMHLAIDDFGTGYSSLKLLRQMPFSVVKIDRSFVIDMEVSRDSRAIVTSVIDLAHNMELECVAEGVETPSVAARLESLEADFLQGYLIARSMPPDHLAGWLLAWTQRAPNAWQADPAAALPAEPPCREETCDTASGVSKLSPRQRAVLELLAEGCSVKDMARRLGLGIGTVKTHVAQAYAALGAHNRIEALRRAGLTLSALDPG